MTRLTETICGISIGTRVIGLAIRKHLELIDWRILTFKTAWSDRKQDKILKKILAFLSKYQVGCLVIKTPPKKYQSDHLKTLISDITIQLRTDQIPYNLVSVNELKQYCFPNEKSNKYKIASFVANSHPELRAIVDREQKLKTKHYTKVFEAVVASYLKDPS